MTTDRSPFMHREREPGSPEAIAAGCTCAADDNAHGQGVILKYSPPGQPTRAWWIAPDCPLHYILSPYSRTPKPPLDKLTAIAQATNQYDLPTEPPHA
jgi:hypothetical protein